MSWSYSHDELSALDEVLPSFSPISSSTKAAAAASQDEIDEYDVIAKLKREADALKRAASSPETVTEKKETINPEDPPVGLKRFHLAASPKRTSRIRKRDEAKSLQVPALHGFHASPPLESEDVKLNSEEDMDDDLWIAGNVHERVVQKPKVAAHSAPPSSGTKPRKRLGRGGAYAGESTGESSEDNAYVSDTHSDTEMSGGDAESISESDTVDESEGEQDLSRPNFDGKFKILTKESTAADSVFVPFFIESPNCVFVNAFANRYLRLYQREGVEFLYHHIKRKHGNGCILNDDMGLGKTIQVICLLLALHKKSGTNADYKAVRERRAARERALLNRRNCSTTPSQVATTSERTTLLIVPLAVLRQWQRELTAWGHFDVEILNDIKHKSGVQEACLRLEACDPRKSPWLPPDRWPEIMLMSSSLLDTNAEVRESIKGLQVGCMVLDEVHTYKNQETIKHKVVDSVHSESRVGLTGTLVQNSLTELYWLLNLICGGKKNPLGQNLSYFKRHFSDVIIKGHDKNANQHDRAQSKQKCKELSALLSRHVLRRTKAWIQAQLPIKREHVVFCKLSGVQSRVYESIVSGKDAKLIKMARSPCTCNRPGMLRGNCCYKIDKDAPLWNFQHCDRGAQACAKCPSCIKLPFITKLIKAATHLDLLRLTDEDKEKYSAEKYTQLAKFAFHAFSVNDFDGTNWSVSNPELDEIGGVHRRDAFFELSSSVNCAKLNVLAKLLNVWRRRIDRDNKVLIFSNFTRVLDIIARYLDSVSLSWCRLDGTMSSAVRQKSVDDFQDPSKSKFCFLISTKAGGVGLNLTSANIVVLFDTLWNPAHELQAQDRAYRLGQLRDVEVFRLVSTGTVEDLMYCRQVYKTQLGNLVSTFDPILAARDAGATANPASSTTSTTTTTAPATVEPKLFAIKELLGMKNLTTYMGAKGFFSTYTSSYKLLQESALVLDKSAPSSSAAPVEELTLEDSLNDDIDDHNLFSKSTLATRTDGQAGELALELAKKSAGSFDVLRNAIPASEQESSAGTSYQASGNRDLAELLRLDELEAVVPDDDDTNAGEEAQHHQRRLGSSNQTVPAAKYNPEIGIAASLLDPQELHGSAHAPRDAPAEDDDGPPTEDDDATRSSWSSSDDEETAQVSNILRVSAHQTVDSRSLHRVSKPTKKMKKRELHLGDPPRKRRR